MTITARIIGTDTNMTATLRPDRRINPHAPYVLHGTRAFIRRHGRTVSGWIDRAMQEPVFVPTGDNRQLAYTE